METNNSDSYYNSSYYGSNLATADYQSASYQSSNYAYQPDYTFPDLSVPPPPLITASPSAPPPSAPYAPVSSSVSSSLYTVPPPLPGTSWSHTQQNSVPVPLYNYMNGTAPSNQEYSKQVQYQSCVPPPPVNYYGPPPSGYSQSRSVPEYSACVEKNFSEPLKENGYVNSTYKPTKSNARYDDYGYAKRKLSPSRRDSHATKSSYKDRSKSPKRNYRDNTKRSRNSPYRSPKSSSSRSRDSKSYESRKYRRSLSRSRSPVNSTYRSRRSPVRRSYRKSSPLSRSSKSSRRSPLASPARSVMQGSDSDQSKLEPKEKEKDEKDKEKVKVKLELPKKDIFLYNNVFAREEKSEESEDERKKLEEVKAAWVRSAPADLYYQRDEKNPSVMKATQKLINLCNTFEATLLKRAAKAREEKEKEKEIANKNEKENSNTQKDNNNGGATSKDISKPCCSISKSCCSSDSNEEEKAFKKFNSTSKCSSRCKVGEKRTRGGANSKKPSKRSKKICVSDCSSSDSGGGCGSDSSSSNSDDEEEWALKGMEEMERKRTHPARLHPELWFNDPGEMNDGPLCRCSLRARRSGIRHGYYAGEEPLKRCELWENNANKLHHYLVTISPPTNFLVKTPTIITHDSHEFIFEGFSLLSHHPLEEIPTCQVIRFNIEYSIYYLEEKIPENFCVKELELFYDYLFKEVLELVDLNFKAVGDEEGCSRFHFMPRFVRQLPDNGKEVLSMNEVLNYLMKNSKALVKEEELDKLIHYSEHDWLNYTDQIKGMIVTYPGKKPCSIRVDQLDRDQLKEDRMNYPIIVHFGIRPPQLSYAGNPEYQKALREYVKFRHLLANMPKPSFNDKRQLEMKENRLQDMRMNCKMKRDVTVAISAQGFYRTGIMCDIVQHALLIPVLVRHLRFHRSLISLEGKIRYKFKTRLLLQLALTHPSYRENFGTNPDHARNSLTNCGVRQPQYGDRRIHFMNTHKRGINTLVNIMSRFGKNEESESKITHNERLEFLGDAVVEFLTSIHLFHLFPALEEGGLATYRAAVVQNQHLSVLADKLSLHQYVLHAHGSDLCHTFELRHAMANCFEALMGAIFIDSNIESADAVFSATLFQGEGELHDIWVNYKPHPLQEQEPQGDRRWIETFPILQKLVEFEDSIGIEFKHIRLLARAFTDRSIGFNYLTLGSNQRLEFLGDTVLQLVASEYLYRFFPEHHEGHLSLLRSSLVNNRTQAVVCDDLQMTKYAMYSNLKTELKTKDRADLLEAFLGAVYIDRGLNYCRVFCLVCFFPRLQQFIINQEWNDPKSKLQQCCLTLRTMEGGEPDIPMYKVIECKGPTNTRVYTVAVYFKDKRLAKASGHSIQQAEMNAAKEALLTNKQLFPQLAYQRRVIEKNIKIQGVDPPSESESKKTIWEGSHRKDSRNLKEDSDRSRRRDEKYKTKRRETPRKDSRRPKPERDENPRDKERERKCDKKLKESDRSKRDEELNKRRDFKDKDKIGERESDYNRKDKEQNNRRDKDRDKINEIESNHRKQDKEQDKRRDNKYRDRITERESDRSKMDKDHDKRRDKVIEKENDRRKKDKEQDKRKDNDRDKIIEKESDCSKKDIFQDKQRDKDRDKIIERGNDGIKNKEQDKLRYNDTDTIMKKEKDSNNDYKQDKQRDNKDMDKSVEKDCDPSEKYINQDKRNDNEETGQTIDEVKDETNLS